MNFILVILICVFGFIFNWFNGSINFRKILQNFTPKMNSQEQQHGGHSRYQTPEPDDTPVVTAVVKKFYPHDRNAYTQGIIMVAGGDGKSYFESNGRYGYSDIREVELETGRIIQQYKMPKEYFAEGLTEHNGQLLQLTWKEHKVFEYNPLKLSAGPVKELEWPREGWGLTSNGEQLIVSDGSAKLYYLDPTTLDVERIVDVKERVDGNLKLVRRLNELEWVDGYIYANVWHSTRVAVIRPETGLVEKWIELGALYPEKCIDETVANGIAFDRKNGRLLVTGKLWPSIYEIEL